MPANGFRCRSAAPAVVSACDRPGCEPLREIALSYNVDYSTIHRLKERYCRGLTKPGVLFLGVKSSPADRKIDALDVQAAIDPIYSSAT